MRQFICLFREIDLLKADLKMYKRGLITYEELNQRLINISILIDYILELGNKYN